MKPRVPDSPIFRKSAHAPLDRRHAERVSIHYRVAYSTETDQNLLKGEGSLKDLSKSGCQMAAAVVPAVGSTLTLFLYIEDGSPPMCLTGAVVSWAAAQQFAVTFPILTSDERKRLQGMIWKHARLSSKTQHRTAFRIV
jgi:hypothetical protein